MIVDFKKIPLLAEADVVIVGGGLAGCAAAVASASKCVKTILLEQSGVLGGLGTLGLGTMFAPRSDGKHDLAEGIGGSLIVEMCRRMGKKDHQGWVAINTEILKKVLDDALLKAGVEVLFQQHVIDVNINKGTVSEIAVSGLSGIKKVKGKVFIDCSGDGMLSLYAGAKCFMGDENGIVMSPTLCVQYSDIDFETYKSSGKNARNYWLKLADAGKAPLLERHYVGLQPGGVHTANGNLGHIYGLNPGDERSLSNGYFEGRSIAEVFLKFHRENVPGFENAELTGTASLLGLRETRRVECDYWMTIEDYKADSSFPDEIGRYNYPIDIHSSTTSAEAQDNVIKHLIATRLKQGQSYAIPYRAICVKGFKNMLLAGRITSSDRSIQSSLRVMPGCFISGQAAGLAAALSVPGNGDIRSEAVVGALLTELDILKHDYAVKMFA